MKQIAQKKISSRFFSLSVSALLFASLLFTHGYALSIEELTKGMTITPVAGIDITYPTRAQPNTSQDIYDLDYWLDTLPYAQDKAAAGYVVYPKAGVIIPLVRPDSNDIQKIQVGDIFDHYKYLEEGALHYVGNAPDQGNGNMVLAVHSSFAKTDPGRYKTAGQVAPVTKLGDRIFLYLADTTGAYTLYVYTVRRSEEIPETQVSILNQTPSEKMLTLFTCYPIGTTDNRRVNQAALTKTMTETERKATKKEHTSAPTTFTTQAVTKPKPTTTLTPKKEATTPPAKKLIIRPEDTKYHQAAPDKEPTTIESEKTTAKAPETEVVKEETAQQTTTQKPAVQQKTPSQPQNNLATALSIKKAQQEARRGVSPTFKERVTYRPVVYRTAIHLISTVGFKRTNLQRLSDAIDLRLELFTETPEIKEQKHATIVAFLMMQEIIEGFMR